MELPKWKTHGLLRISHNYSVIEQMEKPHFYMVMKNLFRQGINWWGLKLQFCIWDLWQFVFLLRFVWDLFTSRRTSGGLSTVSLILKCTMTNEFLRPVGRKKSHFLLTVQLSTRYEMELHYLLRRLLSYKLHLCALLHEYTKYK